MYRYRNNYTCPCQNDDEGCNCPNSMMVTNDPQIANNMDVNMENKCDCGFNDPAIFPDNFMYGQSYVPIQYMNDTFKPDIGLRMGSIFPELISPYEAGDSMQEIEYLRNATSNVGRWPNEL
ncbi:unknown [Clostridium sp. CAG:793]|nr:unknown [Clostridium sp. CAG:793]